MLRGADRGQNGNFDELTMFVHHSLSPATETYRRSYSSNDAAGLSLHRPSFEKAPVLSDSEILPGLDRGSEN
jgi:hypothetical protein